MSAELGGVVDLVAAAGEAIKGVATGVAYLGAAAFHGAAALTKMSVNAAKAVGAATADAFKEIQELHKIVAEEKKRHREAYAAYVNSLEADKIRRKKYINKLESIVAFDHLGIEEPTKSKINTLADGERIRVYNDLINLQSKFNDISNVFFGLADQGIESDFEYEFYKIKKQLAADVNDGNYNFDNIFELLENLLYQIRKLQTTVNNEEAAKFIEAQLFLIENELGNPLLNCFHAELYEMLRLPRQAQDSVEEKLLIVEKDVLNLVRLFGDFNYEFKEKEEFENLLCSVKKIILSDDSAETKLKLIDARYRRMTDIYEKVDSRHGDIFELKRRYNEEISLNYNLKEYLSMPLPQLGFDYRTAAAEVVRLSAENAELSKIVVERQKREYVRKSVRETMKEMQFEYICSQTAATAGGETVETDVYHIENGNVVSVTFVKGRVCCSVSGVKIDGVAENKGSIVRTMKKFCSQSGQIRQKLRGKGVSLEFDECIEPNKRYAREISLKGASASATQIIRGAKLNVKRPAAGAKKKTLN